MATPTIVRRAVAVSAAANATSWTPSFTWNTNTAISSGERVLWVMVVSSDGAPTLSETGGNGWTLQSSGANSTVVTGAVFTKETTTAFAAGTGPAFVLGSTASEQYSAVLLAFKVAGSAVHFAIATPANGSSTNSDPPVVDNPALGSIDAIAVATRSGDSTVVPGSAPSGYSDLINQAAAGTAGASTSTAEKAATVAAFASEDPGTFTVNSEQWVSHSFLVWETPALPALTADAKFVGYAVDKKRGAVSGDTTISLTALQQGSRTAAINGDLVVAVYSSASSGRGDITLAITDGTTDYTLIGSELYPPGSATRRANLRVAYKFMGSTPDTSVTFGPAGNADDGGMMAVLVFSGIDPATPIDPTPSMATGEGTDRPNPDTLTPTLPGALIVGIGAGAANTGAVFTSSDFDGFWSDFIIEANDSELGIGLKAWTSGAFNPAQFGGGASDSDGSWSAMTLALAPVSTTVTHATSGALTGQSGSIAGSAAHIALHATSGALTGQTGSIVGTSTRFRAMATSGALNGQLGSIAGSAARSAAAVTHATDGALVGQVGSLSGTATRFRQFASTGALEGQLGSVAGSAARLRQFASTGVLAGSGATLSGTATHQALHSTSGALSGQLGTVSGVSVRFRTHAASGVLAGPGSTVAGTSVHNIPHSTSGVLAGPGSIIAGDGARAGIEPVSHATSGALTGVGSQVAGSSARTHVFTASGVLTGQVGSVSGVVLRFKAHSATGSLIGQPSSISAAAARYRQFATSGSLVAQGSTVNGTANHSAIHLATGALVGPGSVILGAAEIDALRPPRRATVSRPTLGISIRPRNISTGRR